MTTRPLILAAASGLLLAAAFPTIDLHFTAWVALVPLLLSLRGQSAKTAFWLGGVTGLVYFCGTVYWVTNSVHYYGYIPLIPAALITLLLCAYLALYPALFAAAAARIDSSRPGLVIIALPAIWTALELARTYIFSGFPWSLLGYSQYRLLPMIQIADSAGVYAVSFLIVLVNAAGVRILTDRKAYREVVIAAAAVVLVALYGFIRLAEPEGPQSVRISVIQGNIDQDKKWDPAYQGEVIGIYKRLTLEAMKQKPDLVIWPETATPFYFGGSGDNAKRSEDLKHFVRGIGTPLLTGSPTYEVRSPRAVVLKNSALMLSSEGTVQAWYHKLHLVPFGEYVPLKKLLFFVEKMVQAIGDFEEGKEYTVMPLASRPGARLSTVICYEIIFPDLVRRFVDKGATIITTITNDAWFGRTAAPYQHFSMAVFRAVENRVPVARAANTGISGFIDAKGHVLQTSKTFTEASLTQTIAYGGAATFYSRYGDVFSYGCLIMSIVLLVFVHPKKSM